MTGVYVLLGGVVLVAFIIMLLDLLGRRKGRRSEHHRPA